MPSPYAVRYFFYRLLSAAYSTVSSEFVESIRARIALADLQPTSSVGQQYSRSTILVQLPSDRINYATL